MIRLIILAFGYNRGMTQNLHKRLNQIQKDVTASNTTVSKLIQLRDEAKKAFDERIEQMVYEYGLIKKIRVPKQYLRLWQRRNKHIQIPINWRYLVSSPFIYGMIFPAVIWHLCIETYHQVCFRLYGIPLVNAGEFFIYDRKLLSMLNIWEKINCFYCSYVNNLVRYSSEIGGRTERYWCPIKYYRRIANAHSQYPKFVETDDPEELREQWKELRDFSDLT